MKRIPYADGLGQSSDDTQTSGALAVSTLILAIRELHRQRQDLLRAEGNLTRQIKAIFRRAAGCTPDDNAKDHAAKMAEASAMYKQLDEDVTAGFGPAVMALHAARAGIHVELLGVERVLKKQAKQLPIYERFVLPLKGFGEIGLAQIVGEAGDLEQYSNPAKLWKRFGLAVIGGERQRKCTDAEKALAHGYSPVRRSVMFVLGDSLLRQAGPYKDLYEARKAIEIEKATAEGLTVVPAAKIPKGKAAEFRSAGHVHNRAKRYVEKRLLRDLWRAWTGRGQDYAA